MRHDNLNSANYKLEPGDFPSGKTVDIYIPMPVEHADQLVLEQSLQSSIPGSNGLEAQYGNGYYRIAKTSSLKTRFSYREVSGAHAG